MEIQAIKLPNGIIKLTDAKSLKWLASIPIGETFPLKTISSRVYASHTRWFRFVTRTFDMQDVYADPETWRGVLTILGGHCRAVVDREGFTHIWPESISYEAFSDEAAFNAMFDRAVHGYIEKYGKGLSKADFDRVMAFM